jgi:hypothetical protein
MTAVIQCASSKVAHAGHFRTAGGKPVNFVADPSHASARNGCLFAKPDDPVGNGAGTWRDLVVRYNADHQADNPFGLMQAYLLYARPAYSKLVRALGVPNVFVLSAGWGLIRSSFLTPNYDITFSSAGELYTRRGKDDLYWDFQQLPAAPAGPVCFFGGQSYLRLFETLTADVNAERIVFYTSANTPKVPGCRLVKYKTSARTNWHYLCVKDFLAGKLSLRR